MEYLDLIPATNGYGIWAVVAPLLLLLWFIVGMNRSHKYSTKLPPGTFGLPIIGESLEFLNHINGDHMHDFVGKRKERYGNIFRSHIFGKPYLFVMGQKAAKMMIQGDGDQFQVYQFHNVNKLLGRGSVILASGEDHKRIRHSTSDIFTPEGLRQYVLLIEGVALQSIMSSWTVGKLLNAEEEATKYAFYITAELVLSWKPGPLVDEFIQLSKDLMMGMLRAPINLPGFSYHNSIKARQRMVSIFEQEINRREMEGGRGEKKGDILERMLDVHREGNGEKLSKLEIVDQLVTFILAGHETTVGTISFIVRYLSQRPQCLETLRAEHQEIQRSKPPNTPLTWMDVKRMVYTDKVISEALRMATIVPWLHRKVNEDMDFEGYTIPKGWMIMLDIRDTHYDPDYYSNPDVFTPERFDQAPKPYTFLPFSGGKKICLGKDLARLEMAIFLYHLTINFRWEVEEVAKGIEFLGMARPKGGVPFRVLEKKLHELNV
nr:cytochrome P450 7005C3 [Ginkgo biloba]|eukprot:Gb_04669 [translate_table: standard]